MEIAIDAGADDVDVKDDGAVEVVTTTEVFEAVRQAFETANLEPASASLDMVPDNVIELSVEQATTIIKLIDALEDDEDVQNVFANFDCKDLNEA